MKLVSQHTKKIMEGCKERALAAGLKFDKETLEYIVTNNDMIELSPKHMIPTLYDYWVHDIQVLRGKGEYDLYPNNPYETVINTRPAISFYNDNNPDWLNVMIFYHVLAHIDFFQSNKFFSQTWEYDLKEKALADKRIIARLRSRYGRKVDYIIEFSRGIDNLVGYFNSLKHEEDGLYDNFSPKINYYFGEFLQNVKKANMKEYLDEVERFNSIKENDYNIKDDIFLSTVRERIPEFDALYKKYIDEKGDNEKSDLLQFIAEESQYLNQNENKWMKDVVHIIRDTSVYFSPQIRTKIMNEGWASYWHEKLFLQDDRIKGNEVAFAKINAKVTALSKVGLNPYAIGWRLFMYIEDMADKGKYSFEFQRLNSFEERKAFDTKAGNGKDFIFHVRENYCDSTFINSFIDQDFMNLHKLMVVGERINEQRKVKEYYVKSRRAIDYKNMINESLYHPPHIEFTKKDDGTLLLNHEFEGKELYREYIPNTLIGIEYLWGKAVQLETSEVDWEDMQKKYQESKNKSEEKQIDLTFKRVRYTCKDKKVNKVRI